VSDIFLLASDLVVLRLVPQHYSVTTGQTGCMLFPSVVPCYCSIWVRLVNSLGVLLSVCSKLMMYKFCFRSR